MASVVRKICGHDINTSSMGVSRPDARQSTEYPWLYNHSIYDFRQKLQALPYALVDAGATYTRNSVKNVVQDGALVQLAANQFGTSYDSVTGLYGYLAEPAATNLCLYSEDAGNAYWVYASGSAGVASTAPDGTTTAKPFVEAAANASHYVGSTSTPVTSGTTYTFSAYFKPNGRNVVQFIPPSSQFPATSYVNFDAASVSVTASSGTSNHLIYAIGNGWYRVSFSIAATATASDATFRYGPQSSTTAGRAAAYSGNGTSGIYIWGAQLETGSRATSYIATGAATASRAADVLSVPVANIPGFSSAAYTLFADGRQDALTTTTRRMCVVNDDTPGNRAALYADVSNSIAVIVLSGGVMQAFTVSETVGVSRNKAAAACAVDLFTRAVNGVAGASDTSGLMPASPSILNIGHQLGIEQFNGFIFRAGLVPAALTQAQINGMTS